MTEPPDVEQDSESQEGSYTPTESAEAAIRVGVFVSAVRCIITYVLVPLAGVFGFVLGPIGVLLQLFAAATTTSGARRLWKLHHRLRWPYAALAVVINLMALISILGLLGWGPTRFI